MSESDEGLVDYRLHKMDEHLAAILEKLDNIIEYQHKLDKRQSLTEVKSGIFGTIGGSASVALVLLFEWFKTHAKN